MKFKIILIFLFSFNCYAQEYLVDKIEPMPCSKLNQATLNDELEIQIEDIKWIRNYFRSFEKSKALTKFYQDNGESVNEHYMPISKKYKKWKNSKIVYRYKNGIECQGLGRLRITGDFSDHYYSSDEPISSFALKLDNFAIYNNTSFKVFLPKSRFGVNEIFLTTFLKNLNFLSPETRFVKVKFGKIKSLIMIFQEDINKEFLEKNNFVEGPLVEANENIKIYFFDNLNDLKNYPLWDVKFALPKIKNTKWALRSEDNFNDSLISLNSLNGVFFENIQMHINTKNTKSRKNLNPNFDILNQKSKDSFFILDCIEKVLQLDHASILSNRIFYYDIHDNSVVPIIYDFNFQQKKLSENLVSYYLQNQLNSNCRKNYLYVLKKKILNLDKNNLKNELKNKNINLLAKNDVYNRYQNEIKLIDLDALINNILHNIDFLINNHQSPYRNIKKYKNLDNKIFFDQDSYKLSKNLIVYSINENTHEFEVCGEKCEVVYFSSKQKKKLLDGNLFIDGVYHQLISNHKREINQKHLDNDFKIFSFGRFNKIELIENNLNITTQDPNARILIKNTKIEDLKISFDLKIDQNSNFNNKLLSNLRGCLNFYNVELVNVDIASKNCKLEDSVNIVKSNGQINNLNISNSSSDALDNDFSNLNFKKVVVNYSGNDCLDFSYGTYYIKESDIKNCGDKGISVGEKSILNLGNSTIDNVFLGLVSKDEAKVNINSKITVSNYKRCFAEYRKKQEFMSGEILKQQNIDCLSK